MLKLYFLRSWIKALERAIQISKRFSTSTWRLIALICLMGFFISVIFIGKEERLNPINLQSEIENKNELLNAEFIRVRKTENLYRQKRPKNNQERKKVFREGRKKRIKKLLSSSGSLKSLSKNEKKLILKKSNNLLKKNSGTALLNAIQFAEEKSNPKTIVGGIKSSGFGNYQITKLNLRNDSLAALSSNISFLSGSLVLHPSFNLIYLLEFRLEEMKRYFVNPFKIYVINVSDKSPTPFNWQFWLLLFNGIINAIASISAMILAWISNNRAKAEFLLKQAKDERDKLEMELKIKEMELQITKMQTELDIKSPTIVLAN